jgi:hypothetical protein
MKRLYSLTVTFRDGSTSLFAREAETATNAIAMLACALAGEDGKEVVSIALSDF